MRQLLCYVLAASMVVFAWGADTTTTARKKVLPKKKSTVTAHKTVPTAARKTTQPSKGGIAKKGATTTKGPVKKAPTWRTRQMTPTPERYQEIQNALVAKGYLKQEDVGAGWNQNSVDALKRFQAEEKLDASGKINSLSLIALGLGPKHDSPTARPAENPQ